MPERARAILVHLYTNHLRRLVPVEVDVARMRRAAEQRGEAVRQLAHFRRIRSADPELERPADRGP